MKKKMLIFMAGLMLVSMTATACGATNGTGDAGEEQTKAPANDPVIDELYTAVKNVYGENYLPAMQLTPEDVEMRYGIPQDKYEEVIADIPMMSAHVDEFVLVRVTDEAARAEVEQALTDYQNRLKEDTMQYPANQLKIQASEVYTVGNYVSFLMLGVLDNETQQQEEAKVIEAYRAENEKAIAAMDALFYGE